MLEDAIATTHYGDFAGTISVDGFNGLDVTDIISLADIPRGYWPVGLRISGHSDREGKLPRFSATALCVDEEQAGKTPGEIQAYANRSAELHVFEFDFTLEFADVLKMLKEVNIVLISRLVERATVKIQPKND